MKTSIRRCPCPVRGLSVSKNKSMIVRPRLKNLPLSRHPRERHQCVLDLMEAMGEKNSMEVFSRFGVKPELNASDPFRRYRGKPEFSKVRNALRILGSLASPRVKTHVDPCFA